MNRLVKVTMPAHPDSFVKGPGGGRFGCSGYGTYHMRLFSLYQTWRDDTGVDLGNANSHATDSIHYWIHATVPTLDYFAQLDAQARVSVPALYDYHRRLMLEARYITKAGSEERRAETECGRTLRSRWARFLKYKKNASKAR